MKTIVKFYGEISVTEFKCMISLWEVSECAVTTTFANAPDKIKTDNISKRENR